MGKHCLWGFNVSVCLLQQDRNGNQLHNRTPNEVSPPDVQHADANLNHWITIWITWRNYTLMLLLEIKYQK